MRDDSRQRRSGRNARQGEASSYDEASRLRNQRRFRRFGGSGSDNFDNGIDLTFRLVLLALFVVSLRLVWLQVIRAPFLTESAQYARTEEITLRARRGTIYDRNGNVLAISIDCRTVFCNPLEISDPSAVTTLLCKHLGGTRAQYMPILASNDTFAYIERMVDTNKAEELRKDLVSQGLRGVYFAEDSKRSYPYGDVGGQILGIVGIDGDGLSGLEYYYDDILKGKDGTMTMETGIGGTPIAGAPAVVEKAEDGTDIVISLDVDIQMACEKNITQAVERFQAESGSVMVTNPKTG
ncbi:MAG: penicillin-binding protein 2, partial [Coriobacteriales bacterium]|nr:penicillin-binding protein 2 [Coriobacteriales bacterium]